MRRLGFVWAMSLITILVISILFKVVVDTQIIVILGGIATVAIGATAIKNKGGSRGNNAF